MEKFTNLYSLSKTLRFELKPEPKTKEIFEKWIKNISDNQNEDENNLFLKDKKILKAYQSLKPILDSIHEQFIEKSLMSDKAKKINFTEYFEKYRKKEKNNISDIEKEIREKIGNTFVEGGKIFSQEISKSLSLKKGKNSKNIKESYKCLMDKNILEYVKQNIKEICLDNELSKEELKKDIETFKGFFTYFSGYNINRENYYEYKKEQSSSIATRIIHDNLPIFCNNIIRFENRKAEYIEILQYLKDSKIATQIKTEKGELEQLEIIDDKIFNIEYFNNCLTQKEIEKYNIVVGKYNLLINLYNQAKNQNKNFRKIDEFNKLYKQIGCGKKKILFASLKKDKENELTEDERKENYILSVEKLINVVNEACEQIFNNSKNNCNEIKTIPCFIKFLKNCKDWKGIYLSKNALNKISALYFSNWHDLKDELKKAKICTITSEGEINLSQAIEISTLFSVLDNKKSEFLLKETLFPNDKDEKYKNNATSTNIINLICEDIEQNIKIFNEYKDEILSLKNYRESNNKIKEEDKTITKIKTWFDSILGVIRIIKYFDVPKSKMNGNIANSTMEQALLNLLHNENFEWFKWYDLARNYLTKKPQDDIKRNKLKLNFNKGNLLNGFTDSHTEQSDNATQYGAYIFRKKNYKCDEYEYFLGISENSKLFRCFLKKEIEIKEYESFFSKDKEYTPTKIFEKLQSSKINKFRDILKDKILINKVNETIECIKENCKKFNKIESIRDLIEKNIFVGPEGFINLVNELSNICKEIKIFDFFSISSKEFNEHNGVDLFMFKISNKDLSYCDTFSNGKRKERTNQKENLHTLFFRSLMRENNCNNIVDIGSGEIFLRKKAKEYNYNDDVWKKGHHYDELKNKFSYPIISNKRFAEDKFLFHLSVILNYCAKKYQKPSYAYKDVNNQINNSLQEVKNLNFIGIDRGEKHLVYFCKIDKNGKIIDCNNYDEINGTNYVNKLEEKSNERTQAKKNWQIQNRIKDLKDGYISQVVHKIVNATIKENDSINPNSYIVLEDLNTEMKRGRQKIEKQVYQKLEIALAKKFNFVVDKNVQGEKLGSVTKALQLTPPIDNYQDIEGKKQFGIMLYTRANYTSITDPKTGWRKTIYLKNGTDEEIEKQISNQFTDFGFDGKDYFFKYVEKNTKKEWIIYSGYNGKSLTRFRNRKEVKENYNIFVPEIIDVVDILNKIFVNFDKNKSYKEQIKNNVSLTKINDNNSYLSNKTAWQQLKLVIDLIQQIRNTGEKNSVNDNFLCSPVRDDKGKHFDTRNHENNGDLSKIVDADANGAYNIARKGLIMDAHIKQWIKCGRKEKDLDLFISDEEWDLWLLDRKKWEEKLQIFSSRKNMEEYRKNNK